MYRIILLQYEEFSVLFWKDTVQMFVFCLIMKLRYSHYKVGTFGLLAKYQKGMNMTENEHLNSS